ncbi:TMEM186 family protein [Megaselia abdita]
MNISRIIKQKSFLTSQLTKQVPFFLTSSYTTKSGDDNWSQIYRFPQIRLLSAFNKLKLYQGGLSILAVPAALALEQTGHIPQSTSTVVAALAGTGLATLCIGTLIFRNVVGILYINEDGTRLKVSYPDFWGRRKDDEVVIDEMIPPSNLNKLKWNPALTITTGKSSNYKLLGSFGQILEPDTYFSIFGRD